MQNSKVCPWFRKCSGCTRLGLAYEKQLYDKTRLVREKLGRYAARPDAVKPAVASPAPLGYRASTKLCLSEDAFGRPAIGLYERQSKTVVGIPTCPVHHPAVNALVARLFGPKAPKPPAPFYNHAKRGFQEGRLKFVTIRMAPDGKHAGVVLSHTGVARDALEKWVTALRMPEIAFYETRLTKEDDDLILADDAAHLAGPTTFPYPVGARVYALNPLAFFQANHSLTDAFVAYVTKELKGDVLLDLYGGFGAYGFAAADGFEKVLLVDTNAYAMEAAAAQGDARVQAVAASAEDFLGKKLAPADRKRVTHVIVNPPRGGLSGKTRALLHAAKLPAAKALTYVSCNVETLARDLAELTKQGGWTLAEATPFDMFPQTDHVETVVKLVRAATGSSRPSAPSAPGKRSPKRGS